MADTRTLICEIATPEGKMHEGEATFVVIPTPKGELGILPLHAPLVTTLSAGAVRVTYDENEEPLRFAAAGGYVQVFQDKIIVLADAAVAAEDVDLEGTKARLDSLNEKLGEVEKGSGEFEQLTFDAEWCKTQLRVARGSSK